MKQKISMETLKKSLRYTLIYQWIFQECKFDANKFYELHGMIEGVHYRPIDNLHYISKRVEKILNVILKAMNEKDIEKYEKEWKEIWVIKPKIKLKEVLKGITIRK